MRSATRAVRPRKHDALCIREELKGMLNLQFEKGVTQEINELKSCVTRGKQESTDTYPFHG